VRLPSASRRSSSLAPRFSLKPSPFPFVGVCCSKGPTFLSWFRSFVPSSIQQTELLCTKIIPTLKVPSVASRAQLSRPELCSLKSLPPSEIQFRQLKRRLGTNLKSCYLFYSDPSEGSSGLSPLPRSCRSCVRFPGWAPRPPLFILSFAADMWVPSVSLHLHQRSSFVPSQLPISASGPHSAARVGLYLGIKSPHFVFPKIAEMCYSCINHIFQTVTRNTKYFI
jgi:hypothetical protein